MTAQVWGRGRSSEPLVAVFVADVSRVRTEKRSRAQWDSLYRDWLGQPRPF